MEEHYRVWWQLAPLGLLLVGAGVSVPIDAGARKARGAGGWILEGTAGLVALNAGLSLFGEAVKRRALYDLGSPLSVTRD